MEPYFSDSYTKVYNGDARHMTELADESVQMVCTSPPYWNLRRYAGLGDNQLGMEKTVSEYVTNLIGVLEEVRRVLRSDGTAFINIGDSYNSQPGNGRGGGEKLDGGIPHYSGSQRSGGNGLKPKDLCLIPFRVAIAAQEAGWWVRSVIIWSKPNPMPESVRDRCSESHEYILHLTRSANYYWDAEAVREPQTGNAHSRGSEACNKAYQEARDSYRGFRSPVVDLPAGRNCRSVWTFPTQPYPEAHFAVFPEALPERCIKAATPEVGSCARCGAPWVRVVETTNGSRTRQVGVGQDSAEGTRGRAGELTSTTLGWRPSCKCGTDEKVPAVVLDPFAGSGTTLWVAKRMGRRSVGYELSEEYCRLIVDRNRQAALG